MLAAYEAADERGSIRNARWVIEHGFIPRHDQFPRMKPLGLVVSAMKFARSAAVFPVFVTPARVINSSMFGTSPVGNAAAPIRYSS